MAEKDFLEEQKQTLNPPEEDFVEYELGDVTLEIPVSATPEQVKKAVMDFKQTPDFRMSIDQRTGAPSYVRGIVGSVYKTEDKLNTLKKYYPDAEEWGDDNYIFTNPQTGKITLYNPKGLDLGDVSSIAREGTVFAGSVLGGATGAGLALTAGQMGPQVATPEEFYTVPTAASIGAGLGAGVAGNAYDGLLSAFGLKVDTRKPIEVARDTGVEVLTSAIGEKVGREAPGVIKKMMGGGSKRAQQLAQSFKSLDIDPSATVIAQNTGIARVESGLSQTAAGGTIIDDQAERIVEQTSKAADKIVKKFGEPKTAEGAGAAIKKAALGAVERFGEKQDELYDEAFDLIGSDTKVPLEAVKSLLSRMKSELAKAPKSPTLQKSLGPAIRELQGILDTEKILSQSVDTGLVDDIGQKIVRESTSGGKGFQFGTLRSIRSRIGEEIGDPLTRSLQKTSMARVYAALSEDMGATASSVSQQAANKLSRADKYTKAWNNTAASVMEKLLKNNMTDEGAYKFALSASRDGGSALRLLRRRFTEEEWDIVASTVLDRLGHANPGVQSASGDVFSMSSFVTNWNKLAPEAKESLFAGPRYKAARNSLDTLVDLMSQMKDVKRFANTSKTAGAMHTLLLLNGLGASLGAMATGDTQGGAVGLGGTLVGSILAPKYAAKLITNPEFVKWLAEPVTQGFTSSGAHIAKLITIGKANPDIQQEINEFAKTLKDDQSAKK